MYSTFHKCDTAFQNKTVVSLLVDNTDLTHTARQNTLNMLICAGYNVWKDSWTPPPTTPESATSSTHRSQIRRGEKTTDSPAEVMAKWLDKRRESLPTLSCLCRTRVRKRLSYCNKGRSIVDLIPQLPLPAILVDFVGFIGDPVLCENG